MIEPIISIIVPVYKVEEFLDECVQSLVDQTYRNLEIILVDDGSPDKCPMMCDQWAVKDQRIKVIHKENGGLSSARNAGLNIAKGEFIGFVDSDDKVDKKMYEKLFNAFGTSDDIGVTSCMIFSWKDDEIANFMEKWVIKEPKLISCSEVSVSQIRLKSSFTVWNKLYKSNLVNQVRFMDGRNNEDTRFMYDLGKVLEREKMNLLEIPYPLYYYRKRADSITTTTKVPLAIDVINNYEDMMNETKYEHRTALYEAIKYMYVQKVISFIDELFVNETWYNSYYKIYKRKLHELSTKYIWEHYNLKFFTIYVIQKYIPILRRAFHK